MDSEKIAIITFSDNVDHQNIVYSMYNAIKDKEDVITIGKSAPKSLIAGKSSDNFYFDGPLRPGIELKTFRLDILFRIAKLIKRKKVKYLYFESVHVWNIPIMLLCRRCTKIQVVHDVIPHDLSKAVIMCTKLLCRFSDHIVIHNNKYMETLSKEYKVPEDKITSLELWRDFPPEVSSGHTGRFLYFGRIRQYKGLDTLEKIIRETPEVKYYVVGSPDDESRPIAEKIAGYDNVDANLTEVSEEEMRWYFENSDWIILPYESATQSGVIIDAYKFSRPVMAFNVGAIGEQVQDGINGFLIDSNDYRQFVEKIKYVSSMPADKLDEFSHAAYKIGFDRYSGEAVSAGFIEMLKGI